MIRQSELRANESRGWRSGSGSAGLSLITCTYMGPDEASYASQPLLLCRLFGVQNGHHQNLQRAKQLLEFLVHSNSLVSQSLVSPLTVSYVFLGCSRARDATAASRTFETEAGNRLGQTDTGLLTPISPFSSPWPGTSNNGSPEKWHQVPELELGPGMMSNSEKVEMQQTINHVGAPLSPFHYQLRKVSSHLVQ